MEPPYINLYTCTWYTALFTEPVHQAFFPRSDMPLPRMCLLVFVVEIMGGVWIVEQPVSSLIRFHPRVLVTFSEFRVTWFECGFWQRIFFSQAWKGNQPIVYIYIYIQTCTLQAAGMTCTKQIRDSTCSTAGMVILNQWLKYITEKHVYMGLGTIYNCYIKIKFCWGIWYRHMLDLVSTHAIWIKWGVSVIGPLPQFIICIDPYFPLISSTYRFRRISAHF